MLTTMRVLILALALFDRFDVVESVNAASTGGGLFCQTCRRRQLQEDLNDLGMEDIGRRLSTVPPDDLCCNNPNEFDFLVRDLDLDGAALGVGREELPGTDVVSCVDLCITTKTTDAEEAKCAFYCIRKYQCPERGTAASALDDLVIETCRNDCASGDTACQDDCTDLCEEMTTSAYNDYFVPVSLWFDGRDISDCTGANGGTASEIMAACVAAVAVWESRGYDCSATDTAGGSPDSFQCDCLDPSVCGLVEGGDYTCDGPGDHCPSEAPSLSPSESPSGSPSSLPSASPSGAPSSSPSGSPSGLPSSSPSAAPSSAPSFFSSLTPESSDNFDDLGYDYESYYGSCNTNGAFDLSTGNLNYAIDAPCSDVPSGTISISCSGNNKKLVLTTSIDLVVYLKGGGGGIIYNIAGNGTPTIDLTVPGNGAISQITFMFMCPEV